ncbi:MAG TPA: hypothetical protein VF037_02760 [Gemmatimonadales bacterium]
MTSRSVAVLAVLLAARSVHAQEPLGDLAGRLSAMTAPVGYESAMADTLLGLVGGARDRAGNVVLAARGTGRRRLVACPMDEPGWIVGGVRDDGYLTVRRLPGRMPPFFDQHLEGHRIVVWGRRGAVPGVVAVRSTHLTRGRTVDEAPFTSDQAFIDVGAAAADEVRALGIGVLAPVAREKVPHRYGRSLLAAPAAGRRAACAALIRAARSRTDRVAVAFVVEQDLAARGLLTVINESGPFDDVVLLDGGGAAAPVTAATDSIARGEGVVRLHRWTLRTRFAGTPVETVDLDDAAELERRLVAWMREGR